MELSPLEKLGIGCEAAAILGIAIKDVVLPNLSVHLPEIIETPITGAIFGLFITGFIILISAQNLAGANR